MSTVPRAFLELSPHTVTIAVVSEKRLVAFHSGPRDAKEELAAFVAARKLTAAQVLLVVPPELHALRAEAEVTPDRSPSALLAHLQAYAPAAAAVEAFSARTGEAEAGPSDPLLLAGAPAGAMQDAEAFAKELGLPPALTMLALPGQIGAVMDALQDMSETTSMALWSLGESSSVSALVSARGVGSVRRVEIGYTQIFEAVQAELGLRFRAAATKLFFNADYDFSETAVRIAARLAGPLKDSWGGGTPSLLHLPDLPPGQQWLAQALSQTLDVPVWTEDAAKTCIRNGLTADGVALASATLVRVATHEPKARTRGPDPKAPPAPAASASGSPTDVTAAPFRPFPVAKPAASSPAAAKTEAPPKPKVKIPAVQKPRPAEAAAAAPAPVEPAAPAKPAAPVAGHETVPPLEQPGEEAAAPAEAPAKAKGKRGLLMAVGGVVVVALAVGGVMFSRGGKPAAARAAAHPSAAAAAPAAADALSSFGNARYRFDISKQGVVQHLTDASGRVLVDAIGLDKLQGSYMSSGQRINFNGDGMDSPSHRATVEKVDQPDGAVFNIRIVHPRFEVDETVTCLPDRLRFAVRFIPLKLREDRGVVNAVYSLHVAPAALKGDRPVDWPDHRAVYSTVAGPLTASFDDTLWAHYGTNGRQRVTSTDNTLDFEFIALYSEDISLTLNYELIMP